MGIENIYLLILVCLVGACLGSFFNVVILRSLNNESIVLPPSKCPKCNHKLYFWHNIPIISYILLGGKCYFCNKRISLQYPTIEFLTMILFGAGYLRFGINFDTLFAFVVISALIIMGMTDLKQKIVDCNIAIALAVLGFIYNWLAMGTPLKSILGLLAGAAIVEGIARIGSLFLKQRAMGEADTYVAGAIGACFGPMGVVTVLIYSFMVGVLFALPQYLYRKYKENDTQTFSLFIAFLSLIAIYTIWHNILIYILLLIVAILLCNNVIKNINNNVEGKFLPFVPAIAIATFYYLLIIY